MTSVVIIRKSTLSLSPVLDKKRGPTEKKGKNANKTRVCDNFVMKFIKEKPLSCYITRKIFCRVTFLNNSVAVNIMFIDDSLKCGKHDWLMLSISFPFA